MRSFLLATLSIFGLQSSILAQTPTPVPASASTPSPEMAQILQKLASVKISFDAKKKEVASTAYARYTTGAQSEANAAALYLTCLQMVQGRVPDLDGVTKQDVRDQQDRMKAVSEHNIDVPGRASLLQLQLQFLVFTMDAPAIKERSAVILRLKDFATRAIGMVNTNSSAAPEPQRKVTTPVGGKSRKDQEREKEDRELDRNRRELMQLAKTGVLGSTYAQAFNLSSYFKPMESWPKSLIDLDAIFTDHIIPYYHTNKPEQLAKEWDEYIKLSSALERLSNDDNNFARWLIGGYKNLQWRRSMDLLRHGTNRNAAADELVNLIKENPAHPSVGSWASELELAVNEMLNPTVAPTPVDPTATTSATR